MKVSESLAEVIDSFKNANIESPELDAYVLLADVLNTEKFRLITDSERELSKIHSAKIKSFSKRRIKGEPVAYITGRREFYSLDFIITRDVLIPRPETEQLVDLALYYAKKEASVIDIGTGSGAIAIAVKKNRPDLIVHACDISSKALKIAKKNAAAVLGRNTITFSKSDLFEAYKNHRFDLILTNPPYLDATKKNSLQRELLFEPEKALFAEKNGKEVIERIISEAAEYLNENGFLLIEIGLDQDNYMRTICNNKYSIRIMKDYAGLPRIAVIQKNS